MIVSRDQVLEVPRMRAKTDEAGRGLVALFSSFSFPGGALIAPSSFSSRVFCTRVAVIDPTARSLFAGSIRATDRVRWRQRS